MISFTYECFLGTTTILIAGTTLADAAVIAHPGPTTIADVKALKVRSLLACLVSSCHIYHPFWSRSRQAGLALKVRFSFATLPEELLSPKRVFGRGQLVSN